MQRADAVDVVMPVYNAPELTRRAIDSLYARLGERICELLAWDDASDAPTRAMLDGLRHPRLRVVHAATNTGFGEAVNRAVANTRTPLVLVLNSDVEARSDFLSPLLDAMARDPRLASVSPAGNSLAGYDLPRYPRTHGYVPAYALWGYAFLLRRSAFDEVGGFDRAFGRGYYEDSDLTRRLLEKGWRLGIHPDSDLFHEVHGSFKDVDDYREIVARNRELYFQRWPGARRQLLLVSGDTRLSDLPAELRAELEDVLRKGGAVEWLHAGPARELLAIPMRSARLHLLPALRRMLGRRRKARREFTDLWIAASCPALAAFALERLARYLGLALRRIPAATRSQV
jgi:GT2 family glycosyltransferase